MEKLFRLIYTSARTPQCDQLEIEKILNTCQSNNAKKNITGLLIHTNKRFFQCLEGNKEDVMELYEHIKKDKRHGGAMMRHSGPIKERAFTEWSMAYKDLDHVDLLSESEYSNLHKDIEDLMLGRGPLNSDEGMSILRRFLLVNI
ncbi:BLUF domain-containing protein [Algivirga pacifica]|uniref:BLUF domain-containing protein n=1 Tax=Algivirga pacifica TaxID=1162670 RepID=A0ABP9DF74_9BACT